MLSSKYFFSPSPKGKCGIGNDLYKQCLTIHTDNSGQYRAILPLTKPDIIRLNFIDKRFKVISKPSIHLTSPASEINWVVRQIPYASIKVWVRDMTSGRRLTNFRISFSNVITNNKIKKKNLFALIPARDGAAKTIINFPDTNTRYLVNTCLSQHSSSIPCEETVEVGQDDRIELELKWWKNQVVSGFVTDQLGKPIVGALVWFGHLWEGTGDEPFQSFRTDRIRYSVKTKTDGSFTVRG